MSVVTASATAAAENGRRSDKIETLPEIISVESPDDCGVPSVESFVRNLDTLTEKERAALIADLDELARLEKQIDEIYARMTDGNADKLYDEIDAVNDKSRQSLKGTQSFGSASTMSMTSRLPQTKQT